MTFTQTINETFHVVSCFTCGSNFGINGEVYNRAVDRKIGSIYCPSCGNRTKWTGKTEAEKLQEKLDAKERELVRQQASHDQTSAALKRTDASRRAIKGALTKSKNRVGKGGCPCCKRYFPNLEAHMKNKHPDYAEA